jgi:Holliday junction resolvasome RuvABC endonuclease subunit
MPRTSNIQKPFNGGSLKILALDPATHCGWAISREVYGVWNLSIRKDESDGMRLIRFKSKLLELIEIEHINLVVFERPAGRNARGVITQSELQGITKTECIRLGIAYRAYSSKEIKVMATGKGGCGKPAMIQAAKDRLGYTGDNDNEADALWLLELAKSEYK